MRSVPSAIENRSTLADYVERCAARVEGRLGAFIGYPTGPEFAEFDVVVSRQAAQPYSSASLIKLPVLGALYRRYDSSLKSLDDREPLAERNRVGGAGVLHLLDNPEPTLRDLARAMITISDNAAANQLIDHLGIEAVNETATELGMTETHLGRKMMTTLEGGAETASVGGDTEDTPINTTSPRDCATFFAALWYGSVYSADVAEEQREVLRQQKDNRMFSRYFPYDCTVAHKTGWLPDAALDAGLIEDDVDRPLCFAVFCDQATNGGDATDVIAEIGAATLKWSGISA